MTFMPSLGTDSPRVSIYQMVGITRRVSCLPLDESAWFTSGTMWVAEFARIPGAFLGMLANSATDHPRDCYPTLNRADESAHESSRQVAVGVDAAVAQKRPVAPHVLDAAPVAGKHQRLLAV